MTSGARDAVAVGAAAQAELLAAGTITSRALTAATLDAVEAAHASLNATVAIYRDRALADADAADELRASGGAGPLTGVPIAIKDDLPIAGEVTGWGSRAMHRRAETDSDYVAAVRAAGMVVVAKTTLPELAITGFTEPVATGVTRNPHHADHTCGGSSGGSGALVGAGAIGIASASDGAGSIRIPAACCGVVGFKSTNGRMPSSGGWHGLSTQGCVTPRVADTALFLDTIGTFETSLVAATARPPEPLRIGLSFSAAAAARPAPLDPAVRATLESTAERLRELGHDVTEVEIPYGLASKTLTARYLGGIRDNTRLVDDPSLLEDRTRGIARLGAPFGRRAVAYARRKGAEWGGAVHDELGVDVLLTPVMAGPPIPIGHWAGLGGLRLVLTMNAFYAYTAQWNHAGVPAVSMPVGHTDDGLPLAAQLVARRDDDARLISLAAQLEAA